MTDAHIARIMTREEFELQGSDFLYLEFADNPDVMRVKICQIEYHKKLFRWQIVICFCTLGECGQIEADIKYMGKLWRCWTQPPTDEQRRATPWN